MLSLHLLQSHHFHKIWYLNFALVFILIFYCFTFASFFFLFAFLFCYSCIISHTLVSCFTHSVWLPWQLFLSFWSKEKAFFKVNLIMEGTILFCFPNSLVRASSYGSGFDSKLEFPAWAKFCRRKLGGGSWKTH